MPTPQQSIEYQDEKHADCKVPVGVIGHLEEAVVIPIAMHIDRAPSGHGSDH
jgi:hypothetical protein